MKLPWDLKDEAEAEAYELINEHLRPLPKNSRGKIVKHGKALNDNDVDALRHAYVSGVVTQEYGETIASMLGTGYERAPGRGTSTDSDKSEES